MLSAGGVPVNNGRSGAFQVHGVYFRQGWVLAVVLKTLGQQFKTDGYYFAEDSWQKTVLSLAGLLLICMVTLLLSVLWLVWDHQVLFWWC